VHYGWKPGKTDMLSIRNLDRICLVAIVVIVVLSGFWVAKNGMNRRLETQKANELLTKRLEDLTLANASLQHLRKVVADKRSDLKFLNAQIPESAEIGKFLRRMDELIGAREINLISIQPMATTQETLYTRIPIQMSLTGSFINAYRLLRDFEGMDRLINVERLLIAKLGEDETCKVDLTTVVFER
jgi:Tfp pilus assembly protein PilO